MNESVNGVFAYNALLKLTYSLIPRTHTNTNEFASNLCIEGGGNIFGIRNTFQCTNMHNKGHTGIRCAWTVFPSGLGTLIQINRITIKMCYWFVNRLIDCGLVWFVECANYLNNLHWYWISGLNKTQICHTVWMNGYQRIQTTWMEFCFETDS